MSPAGHPTAQTTPAAVHVLVCAASRVARLPIPGSQACWGKGAVAGLAISITAGCHLLPCSYITCVGAQHTVICTHSCTHNCSFSTHISPACTCTPHCPSMPAAAQQFFHMKKSNLGPLGFLGRPGMKGGWWGRPGCSGPRGPPGPKGSGRSGYTPGI